MRVYRRTSFLAVLALLFSGLTALATLSSPAAAAPGDFLERWCTVGGDRPCLVSAKVNGTALTGPADPLFDVVMTGELTNPDFKYFHFAVQAGTGDVLLGDTWELLFDTGSMNPNYTEAYAGKPDVDRFKAGDDSWRIRYTAKTVRTTDGCDFNEPWPWPCPDHPTDSRIELSGEVHSRTDEFRGFDRSQTADGVNGIFLETATDGSRYLSTEMVNSHFQDAGPTPFVGEVRFRIPHTMLRDSFGVPDPETMVGSSLSGTVNGGTTGATFNVFQDPDGGGVIVDITDITFSVKRFKVRKGTITPTRPRITKAVRVSGTAGKLVHTRAEARGAKVTGYAAKCTRSGHTVKALLRRPRSTAIVVKGLTPGRAYSCKVWATSKVGPGVKSRAKRL